MKKGEYVFIKLIEFIERFFEYQEKYVVNRYVKLFTYYNLLCVLMFGQSSNLEKRKKSRSGNADYASSRSSHIISLLFKLRFIRQLTYSSKQQYRVYL